MFFRKKDKEKRTYLRNHITKAEKYLWQELRKKKISGFRFRRQFSIKGFVVDFYCMEAKLAIEVDGEYHRFNQEYDQARESIIRALGIDFLRFTNEEVLKDWEIVSLKIEKRLHERCSRRDEGAGEQSEPEGA